MAITELPSAGALCVTAEISWGDPSTIFTYWTDPDLLSQWWPEEAEIDPSIGGIYHLHWKTHFTSTMTGLITAFEPGRHLGFTWHWSHYPEDRAPLRVDVRFEPWEGGTRLTVEHGPIGGSGEQAVMRVGLLNGWDQFLGRLQDLNVTV